MIKITVSKQKIIDGYVIFSLFIIPSSFLGLISYRVFYVPGIFDLKLLSWLLALPLLFIYGKKLREIIRSTSGKLLILVILFITFRFILSLINGISFKESFTVFRMGFNTPISSIAYLCFFYSIDNYRIERIFKWGFALFAVALVMYFLNYLGFGLFDNIKERNEETHESITIVRNLTGFPIYFPTFFTLGLFLALDKWKLKFLIVSLFSLLIVYLSATRSFIIVYSVILTIVFTFYFIKLKTGYFRRAFILFLTIVFFLATAFVFKSDVYIFLEKKFESTVNVDLKDDIGTYAYRKRLIESSFQENRMTNSCFFGKGYTREGEKGSYKFVLGGDTLIAPVVFCEGLVGLFFRTLPILYFLLFAFIKMRGTGYIQFFRIGIVALIVSSAVNYVQTTIFYNYVDYVLFFYIAQLYIKNDSFHILKNDSQPLQALE